MIVNGVMPLTLFVDESGNTGGDLHEAAQPIFVHAGVWLDEEAARVLEADVARLHLEYRIQQPLQKLKGHTLVGSGRGQKFVRDVLRALHARKTNLAVSILDKPFVAAAVLLEDCCDYVYNEAFDVSWTTSPRKELLALRIYQTVAQPLLEAAWESRRAGAEAMGAAFERVFGVLRLSGDAELISLAKRMAQVDYAHLSRTIEGARSTSGSDYSPNLTTYSVLVPMCDIQADSLTGAGQGTRVVHDEQVEFADLFTYWFSVWKNSSPFVEDSGQGVELRMPLKNLSAIMFARSEDQIGIRLADILASAVRVAVQDLLLGSRRTNDFFGALRNLCCSRELWGQFPYVIGGRDTQRRVWNHLAPPTQWR